MIILPIILFLIIYFLISLKVIAVARRKSKKRYGKAWPGGFLAAFVMYNLVFWDWIPVVAMHKYYCATDAGFWVYQTPEEWVKNNPELSKQVWVKQGKRKREHFQSKSGLYSREWYSDNIYDEFEYDRSFFHAIERSESRLFDANSKELLAKSIQYDRGGDFGSVGLTGYKFWLPFGGKWCISDDGQHYARMYKTYFDNFIETAGFKGE